MEFHFISPCGAKLCEAVDTLAEEKRMLMKILIGKFGHEANTFASHHEQFEPYAASGSLCRGEAIIPTFRGTPDYIGGMIDAAEEAGAALIPTIACLTAAPTLTSTCARRVSDELMDAVRRHKDEIDGICLGLHGAGCSEDTDDLEGEVLERVREVVGAEMPVMVTLDLHANVSEKMVRLADGLFGIRQYPHIDMYDPGYLAMKTLISVLRTGKKPETALCALPMLISHAAGYTFAEPFLSIREYFDSYCREHQLLSATLFHGFAPADTADTRTSVVVVGMHGAQQAADELARYIWSRRREFVPESLSAAQALDRAAAVQKDGYVVINELSDNPGGGTPGDGTHLLREMLRRNAPRSIFGYIYDPEAVAEIFRHRVGETISLRLGGRTEPLHGAPLELSAAEILAMSNGRVIYVSPVHCGLPDTIGKCARIRQGNVEIIVGSVLHQTYDDRPFLVTGADVSQYRYVGLKSAHHFRAFFEPRAAAIIAADPPGLMSGDLSRYCFEKLPRPIFPLDDVPEDAPLFRCCKHGTP